MGADSFTELAENVSNLATARLDNNEDAKRFGVLVPMSHYVRKMLVQQLLGERLHSDWQKAIGQLPHNIEEIEQGA